MSWSKASWKLQAWYWLDENHKPHLATCREEYELVVRRMDNGEDGVAYDVVKVAPRVTVSTVFLSYDRGFGWMAGRENYEPVLWETMVFGGELDGEYQRYTSYAAALAGHAEMLKRVREAENIFEHERAIEWE